MSHSEQDITVLQCWRILLCCWAAQQDAPALSGGLYWEILPWSGGCTVKYSTVQHCTGFTLYNTPP